MKVRSLAILILPAALSACAVHVGDGRAPSIASLRPDEARALHSRCKGTSEGSPSSECGFDAEKDR
jgi:hypothetical protein